ncbi:hypothetical protein [Xanthomonas sp. NCPPB 2632]|uniref:hypothetical protein n=1 Tax=Xanthomonas sp. NCPPB 2632 TaxID=3240912 RepID=UPI00351748AB
MDDEGVETEPPRYLVLLGDHVVKSHDSEGAALASTVDLNRRYRDARLPALIRRKRKFIQLISVTLGAWLTEVTEYLREQDETVSIRTVFEVAIPGTDTTTRATLEEAMAVIAAYEEWLMRLPAPEPPEVGPNGPRGRRPHQSRQ